MSKTFKCVEHEEEVLEVRGYESLHDGRRFALTLPHVGRNEGVALCASTAPALALAILKAAGLGESDREKGVMSHSAKAIYLLRVVIEEQERATDEAKDKAKLEAEALALLNASLASCDLGQIELFDALNPLEQQRWLAVARRAREMAKEATK